MATGSWRNDLLTIGEALWTFAADDSASLEDATRFHSFLAGAECNVAIAAASLGLSTGWVGRVGDDAFGRAVLRTLERAGVDGSAATVDPVRATGVMFKGAVSGESVEYEYRRVGSAGSALGAEDLDRERIAAARALHVSGIMLALSQLAAEAVEAAITTARADATTVSFDVNYRPRLWRERDPRPAFRTCIEGADLCFANQHEAELITGQDDPRGACEELAGLGPRVVLVKLGSRGALASLGGVIREIPACPANPVDANGAGDAFAAGYLAGFLHGIGDLDAARLAAWCGARAAETRGDSVTLPGFEETLRMARQVAGVG